MPRILAASLALGLWALAGTAWGQPPRFFPIAYATDSSASPRCELPFDPSLPEFHENEELDEPVIPEVVIIPEGSTRELDLCFINWSDDTITVSGTPCSDGTGAKTCALKFEYAVSSVAPGITIQSATEGGVAAPNFPNFAIMWDPLDPLSSVSLMGGDPINGQPPDGTDPNVGFRVATVELEAVRVPGTFVLASGKLANERLEPVDLPITDIELVRVVPEPGMTVMLVSGIAFLLAIGRSRIQP